MFRLMLWFFVMTGALVGCKGQTSSPKTVPTNGPSQPTTTVMPEPQPVPASVTPVSETPLAAKTAGTPALSADGRPILFADNFQSVSGHVHRRVNGAVSLDGPFPTRRLRLFADPKPQGDYALEFQEDPETLGADGQPGVLRATWAQVPKKFDYSGFVYVGTEHDRGGLPLPAVSAAKTVMHLTGIAVRMKLRAINLNGPPPAAFPIRLRLEIDGPDAYLNRCDFGEFEITEAWQTIEAELSEGENVEIFVEAIKEHQTTQFKLLWTQASGIVDYRAGDTLLIDDIEIVGPKPAVED